MANRRVVDLETQLKGEGGRWYIAEDLDRVAMPIVGNRDLERKRDYGGDNK